MEKTKTYKPNQKILEKYVDVLVNFALNKEKRIQKRDTVLITVSESAKPLFYEIQKAVLQAGGNALIRYLPDDDAKYNFSKMFYDNASKEQLSFVAQKYQKGLADQIDHSIYIISEVDKKSLQKINSKK